MANLIIQKIENDGYIHLLLFDKKADLFTTGRTGDTVYQVIKDESNTDKPTSYTWDGTQYVKLSDLATDFLMYDNKNAFPITGSIDSLYYEKEYGYIYKWSTDINSYVFFKELSTKDIQLILGVQVRYGSKAVPPETLNLNDVYTIKFDTKLYVENNFTKLKIYLNTSQITWYFLPLDGRVWSDVLGNYIPIQPPPDPLQKYAGDMLKRIYDNNGNLMVDNAENSLRLGGYTASYFTAYTDNAVRNVAIDLTPVTTQIEALKTSKIESISLKNNNTVIGDGTILNFSKDFLVVKDATDPKQLNIVKPIDINTLQESQNFANSVGENGLSINYSWINANADNFTKTVLFVSKADISNINYDTCLNDATGTIKKVKESTVKGVGDTSSTVSESLTKYYSKIFTIYTIDGIVYSTRGLTLTIETKDDTPPMPISNLSINQESKDSAKLTWTNPTDNRFKGVSIVRKVGNFPSDEHDGQEIYRGSDISYIDKGLSLNTNYFYKAFSYSITNKYASSATAQVQFALDNVAPNPITSESVTKGYQLLKLKWIGSNSIDVKKTILLRKVGSVGSTTPEDGSLILTLLASENNKYQNTFYVDGGLSNGESYTYTWFVYDTYDNISTSVSVTGQTSTDLVPELQMFKVSNLENGTKQSITWTNPSVIPTGLTFLEREVYYTTNMLVDVNVMDRAQCLADATNLTKLTNGIGQGVGKTESFELTTIPYGSMIQFRYFCKYNNGVADIWTVGETYIHIVRDETPPNRVTNLTYIGGDSQVNITWRNPIDTDFNKIEVYRKLGDYPTGLVDSEKVYTLTTQNLNNDNTFIDTGLENDKTYYYQFIIYDNAGNTNKEDKFTCATLALQAYTVEYDLVTDTMVRKDLSNSKTVADLLATTLYRNQGKRCVVKDDGIVNYYLDPNNSALKENGQPSVLDGTDGQVMSEFNKFWVKIAIKDTTKLSISISPTALVGYVVPPMFVSNGVTYDKVYVSCFESYKNTTTNKLESRIGVLPTTNLDVATTRVLAKARGTNWSCWNRHVLDTMRLLYIVLYANSNSQTTIGKGIVNDTQIHQNGETVSMGNKNGTTATIEDGKHAISLFGLENLWGNVYEFIDGIVITDTNAYVADYNYDSFTSPSSLGSYKQITGFNPYGGYSGFVNGLYFTETYPTMFFANKFTGSDSTYTCDFTINKQPNGFAYQYSGFKYDADTKAGIFATAYINSNVNATTKDFTTVSGGLESTGSYQKITFNKTTDGAPDGIKNLTSLSIDDTTATFKLNLSYEMSNVATRLMVLK